MRETPEEREAERSQAQDQELLKALDEIVRLLKKIEANTRTMTFAG